MYREVLRRRASPWTPSTLKPSSTWRASRPAIAATHRPRFLSTPVPPSDQRGVPPPPSTTSRLEAEQRTPASAPSALSAQEQSPTHPPPPSSSEPEPEPGRPSTGEEDRLAQVRAQLRDATHDTVRRMRERGDAFTVKVARTFAQLGSELNRVTGYEEIEALKKRVVEQEARINNAREAARQAKEAYDRAVRERAQSQREVNDLLQRKSHWTDGDVSRFTALVREDHAREQGEARAKAAAAAAEDAVEREFSELMRVILNRYHEEQAWSDKIRSASTYGSLAALALNMAVFVLALVLVEPWKRRRLAQTFERKVEEMSAATADAFERRTAELGARLDDQGRLLALVLETVHLTNQVSHTELASLGGEDEDAKTAQGNPSGRGRIPTVANLEQDVLIAVTASAAAAGLLGWLARSWYG
ncbi:Mdm33 family-domain-containing protein [Trametes elegans]|nr:Mdm33 family-domain-containing protein [Trametes elegans]